MPSVIALSQAESVMQNHRFFGGSSCVLCGSSFSCFWRNNTNQHRGLLKYSLVIKTWLLQPTFKDLLVTKSGALNNYTVRPERCPIRLALPPRSLRQDGHDRLLKNSFSVTASLHDVVVIVCPLRNVHIIKHASNCIQLYSYRTAEGDPKKG